MERAKNRIIFDLDSTLVWCWFLDTDDEKAKFDKIKSSKKYNKIKNDIFLYQLVDAKDGCKKGTGSINNVAIFLRPGIREFLRYVSEFFEIDIWSAGEMRYVRMIAHVLTTLVDNLKITNIHTKRDCIISSKSVSKRISDKNYDLRRSLIIDDRTDVCRENNGNSIKIPEFSPQTSSKFFEYFEETHLVTLMVWMKNTNLKNLEDIREIDKRTIFS